MKKALYIFSFLFSFGAYAQSGIHTKAPQVTLEVKAKNTNGSTPEGIIAPRMTGEALYTANTNQVYGQEQDGAIVFVTEPPIVSHRIAQTIDIDAQGYYHYDFSANKWKKFSFQDKSLAQVGSLTCTSISFSNTHFVKDVAYSGTLQVPYTNASVGEYSYSSFQSNGLTFILPAGTLTSTTGTLAYHVSGIPANSGTFTVPVMFNGTSCNVTYSVLAPTTVSDLKCNQFQLNPLNINKGMPYTGTLKIPYDGGNGRTYPQSIVTSSGLTFVLSAGTLQNGSGMLEYAVSGTPTTSGSLFVPIRFANKSCVINIAVAVPPFESISCEDFTTLGGEHMLVPYPTLHQPVEPNTTLTVRYKGGDGTIHPPGYSFTVGGLTFKRRAVELSYGVGGVIIYDVTGTPTQLSIEVPIEFYGHECTFYIGLQDDEHLAIKGRIWKRHNLGADTSLDPDVFSEELFGNYYQWGKKNPVATIDGIIGTWTSAVVTGSTDWNSLPANPIGNNIQGNPCPAGFKVPSEAEGTALLTYSANKGTWHAGTTNYTNGRVLLLSNGSGYQLSFPAAGYRSNHLNGALTGVGTFGDYWLSTPSNTNAFNILFRSGYNNVDNGTRADGYSVRCISVPEN